MPASLPCRFEYRPAGTSVPTPRSPVLFQNRRPEAAIVSLKITYEAKAASGPAHCSKPEAIADRGFGAAAKIRAAGVEALRPRASLDQMAAHAGALGDHDA